MSHFSRLKTKFKNREILMECLKEMGYQIQEGGFIRGYHGQQAVDLAIQVKKGYGIGFVRNEDGTYDMVADWWGVKGVDDQQLLSTLQDRVNAIQRKYTLQMVLEQTQKQGYSVVERTDEKDGSIRLVVRRWAE